MIVRFEKLPERMMHGAADYIGDPKARVLLEDIAGELSPHFKDRIGVSPYMVQINSRGKSYTGAAYCIDLVRPVYLGPSYSGEIWRIILTARFDEEKDAYFLEIIDSRAELFLRQYMGSRKEIKIRLAQSSLN